MTRIGALMLCVLTTGSAAADDVFRCTDSAGKVLYANAPCESQGASTTRKFKRDELEPTVVKMPKAAPRADRTGTGSEGASLIDSLCGRPIDPEVRSEVREIGGSSGPRNLALACMQKQAAETGAGVGRAKARARDLLPE